MRQKLFNNEIICMEFLAFFIKNRIISHIYKFFVNYIQNNIILVLPILFIQKLLETISQIQLTFRSSQLHLFCVKIYKFFA